MLRTIGSDASGDLDVTIWVLNFAVQDKFDARAVGDLGGDSGPPRRDCPNGVDDDRGRLAGCDQFYSMGVNGKIKRAGSLFNLARRLFLVNSAIQMVVARAWIWSVGTSLWMAHRSATRAPTE